MLYLKLVVNTEETCKNKLMLKNILLLLITPLIGLSENIDTLFKEKGEIYFSFEYKNKLELNKISKIVSIDHKITSEIALLRTKENS